MRDLTTIVKEWDVNLQKRILLYKSGKQSTSVFAELEKEGATLAREIKKAFMARDIKPGLGANIEDIDNVRPFDDLTAWELGLKLI